MTLPEDFVKDLSDFMNEEELYVFAKALTETEQTTCIRMNASKGMSDKTITERLAGDDSEISTIGWNEKEGRYLKNRPNFTLDPLLHAGCYYVQEASSQFITHIVRTLIEEPVTALDLCAAPGGKSTALLSVLPAGSQLVSNEIDRRRARILSENVTKWGNPNVTVTCNAPKDFANLYQLFDVIVTDVPCSGEGMFRKDEGAISDWSSTKVKNCTELQKEIVETIWPCLKPGGLLIYSTCTFNVHEDEENVAWICEEMNGECIDIPVNSSWNIHKPLLGSRSCYRFMPHYTQGEGLFMACIRKGQNEVSGIHKDHKSKKSKSSTKKSKPQIAIDNCRKWVNVRGELEYTDEGVIRLIPDAHKSLHDALSGQGLYILQSGIELGTIKGKDIIPAHALALSTALEYTSFPQINVDLDTALTYLRKEAILLPEETPKGYVIICFEDHPLGFVKNIGNRSNNLYPQEWRIRFC